MASKIKARPPETVISGKIKMVIFGPPGAGKTTLALGFPTPLYYDTEGGARGPQYRDLLKKSDGGYIGQEDGSLSFDTLIEQMQALSTEKHRFRTLIVDSLTKLFQTTVAQEAERLGDKDAFGASKKPAVAAMRRLLMWASRLDMNIIFICHEATEYGLVNGQRAEIGKIADAWEKISYELDLSIQVQKRGPQRVAIVKKSRLVGFPDMETFPLEYAEFAARFGRDAVEGEVGTIIMALPEQIADIKRLLEIVKVDETAIQKDFDKLGIASWEEMTSDQITSRINSLKKKLSA